MGLQRKEKRWNEIMHDNLCIVSSSCYINFQVMSSDPEPKRKLKQIFMAATRWSSSSSMIYIYIFENSRSRNEMLTKEFKAKIIQSAIPMSFLNQTVLSLICPQNCCCPILMLLALQSNAFILWNVCLLEFKFLPKKKKCSCFYHTETARATFHVFSFF